MPANVISATSAAMPTQAQATGPAGDAASAGDFVSLLQQQLALGVAADIAVPEIAANDSPIALTTSADESDSGNTTTDIGADPSALMASLALITPPVSAPVSTATNVGETAGSDALTTLPDSSTQKMAPSARDTATTSDTAARATAATSAEESAAKFAVATPVGNEKSASAETTADTQTTDLPTVHHNIHANASTHSARDVASPSISTPVRSQEWAAEFSQKVVWMASADKQSAQLTLNPAEMGPIEISLSIDNGNASVSFASANAEVRDSIETAMPRLREMFASAGIELGQTNVGAESFRQQNSDAQSPASASRSTSDNAILAADTASAVQSRGLSAQRGNGLVDLFA